MQTRKLSIILTLGMLSLVASRVFAQLEPMRSPPQELPDNVTIALAGIDDFTPGFDHQSFFMLVKHMRDSGNLPGHVTPVEDLEDWSVLTETPSAYRGQPVKVTGVVGKVSAFPTRGYGDFGGPVWKVQIRASGQPITMVLAFINDASDLHVGDTITATGYFVKTYKIVKTVSKKEGDAYAGVIVSPGPDKIETKVGVIPEAEPKQSKKQTLVITAIASGLLLAWWFLRRSVAGKRTVRGDYHSLHARHDAPINLADDLQNWAEDETPPPADITDLPKEDENDADDR